MFRKDQPFLCQLPDEILQDRIIALLPPADQAALRRTSKLLYDITTRPLYRYVSLSTIPQILKFCIVLTAKPAFAGAVRAFVVTGRPRRQLDGPLFGSFMRIFRSAIALLHHVMHIDLNIFLGISDGRFPLILGEQCMFPLLRELKVLDMSLLSPSFLHRHPTLEYLGLRQILCPCELPPEHRGGVSPKLRTFIGPFKLLPLVIPNSAVFHAGLMCGHILPMQRWVNLMLCLRQSRAPIWVFECHMRAFQKDMMLTMGHYLPDLRVLRLLDKHVWTEPEARDMLVGLSALKTVLPQLRHLQSIELLLVERPPEVFPNAELIQTIVSDFGDSCPSLKHMAMYGLIWMRQNNNAWTQVTPHHGERIEITISVPSPRMRSGVAT